jgi:hypothetical protein
VTSIKDPVDLYRVWVPAGASVAARVSPSKGLTLRLWSDQTQTVNERGSDRRSDLLATGSSGVLRYRSTETRGRYLYLEVELNGSRRSTVRYTLSVSTGGL